MSRISGDFRPYKYNGIKMPTYDYRCSSCHVIREVKHKMNEEPIIRCDQCGQDMIKMISRPPIVEYKGKWFKNEGKY